MAPAERTAQIGLRLAPSELAMVNELAEQIGESTSVVVRMAIREFYKARFGDKPPKVSKPRRK